MKIEKTCVLPFAIESVWTSFSNADVVGSCVPGVDKVETIDATHYVVTVTVKVGIIKPTFRLNVALLELDAPRFLRSSCSGEANGMLGSLRQTTEVLLEAKGRNETAVSVHAEVDVFGRLGTFGYGVLKGKADQIWNDFVANFTSAVRAREAHA